MRTFLLAVLVITVGFCSNAAAQAAAEAVLTHSISTGIGTHVGTALGNATNQLAGRVAQQTSTAVPRQTITTVKPGARGQSKVQAASAAVPTTGNGSLIASIQGGEPQASGCAAVAKAADAKAPAVDAKQKNCASSATQASDAHPSVINLPAAQ